MKIAELKEMDLVAPIANGNYLQQISSKINLIRDKHILKIIFSSFAKFNRILVIYGASHFLTQRDVFEQYLGEAVYIPSCPLHNAMR